jgi:hypothetical protein
MSATQDPPPADWYPDPLNRHERRYWDGQLWTEHVFSREVQSVDPMSPTQPIREPAQVISRVQETPTRGTGQTASEEGANLQPEPTQQPAKVRFFGARKAAHDAQGENIRLQELVDRHGLREIADLDAARQDLELRIADAGQQLAGARAAINSSVAERDVIAAEVVDLRGTAALQDLSIYDYEHPAEASVSLATELATIRAQIKQAATAGQATKAASGFTFNNSKAKGDKFVRDMSKLMLRSYNAEAENCIKSVRAGNLDSAQKRLGTTVTQVQRLGTMIDLQITPFYHGLRLKELEIASRHLQALQTEKELERERREELRQQKQAGLELAREKERLEKERGHYANVLETLLANGDLEGAERMRAQLADVERAIADVDYRAANIRAGYVYVISNIGSFGPEVVKIGMTRRLEPMDRVDELGDASVPFRFDVHALFFTEDAVAVESMLHRHFAGQRLNRVNLRREYFRTTPAAVLAALQEHQVEVLEYTVEPAAPEYRSSIPASCCAET